MSVRNLSSKAVTIAFLCSVLKQLQALTLQYAVQAHYSFVCMHLFIYNINHFEIIGMKDLIIPTAMSDWCTYRPFVIQYMAVLPCILSLLMLCVLSM